MSDTDTTYIIYWKPGSTLPHRCYAFTAQKDALVWMDGFHHGNGPSGGGGHAAVVWGADNWGGDSHRDWRAAEAMVKRAMAREGGTQ